MLLQALSEYPDRLSIGHSALRTQSQKTTKTVAIPYLEFGLVIRSRSTTCRQGLASPEMIPNPLYAPDWVVDLPAFPIDRDALRGQKIPVAYLLPVDLPMRYYRRSAGVFRSPLKGASGNDGTVKNGNHLLSAVPKQKIPNNALNSNHLRRCTPQGAG